MKKKASHDLELVAAIEREQRQIGYELHDNLCQTLAGTSMLLVSIGRAVAAGEAVSAQSFRRLEHILETVIDQTRSLSRNFNPVQLEGSGLMKALQDLANNHPACHFVCTKPVFLRDPERALALYRIAQEALKNALQHSGARKITVSLYEINGHFILKVRDNGRGFSPAKQNGVMNGLQIMRRRAQAQDGELKLTSRVGTGTTVTCKLEAL